MGKPKKSQNSLPDSSGTSNRFGALSQLTHPQDAPKTSSADSKSLYQGDERLTCLSKDLRWVVVGMIGTEGTKDVANSMQDVDLSNQSSIDARKALCNTDQNRDHIIHEALKAFEQVQKDKGKDFNQRRVRRELEKHYPNIYEAYFQHMVKVAREAKDAVKAPKLESQKRRWMINRVLKQVRNQALPYELLGVQTEATEKEIKQAHKNKTLLIHPDKNNDPDSNRCMQAINDARDALLDPSRREKIDQFIKSNPSVSPNEKDFDEDFHSNAFDDDDDSIENEDETDSEGEDEKSIPPKPQKIKNLHDKMDPLVAQLFRTFDQNEALATKIDHLNEKISRENKRQKTRSDAYKFEGRHALMYQLLQRRIPLNYEIHSITSDVALGEVKSLEQSFKKASERSLHQWPSNWVQYIIEPLRSKLKEMGVSDDENMSDAEDTAGTEDTDDSDDDSGVGRTDEDEDLPDADLVEQPLRPGYTRYGEEIIAYKPLERFNRESQSSFNIGFDFFIKVKGRNPLAMRSEAEVGHEAAAAYDKLSDNVKNDVRNSEQRYGKLPKGSYGRILGVVSPEIPATGFGITYVWVEKAYEPNPKQAHVMTRSALRRWLGPKKADKAIDDFFAQINKTPAWAQDLPAVRSKDVQLAFPPRRPVERRRLMPSAELDQAQDQQASQHIQQLIEGFRGFLIEFADQQTRQLREINDKVTL